MTDLWIELGLVRWPLVLSLFAVLTLAALSANQLFGSFPRSGVQARRSVDGVIFWGAFAFVCGLLGTLVGVTQAARTVELAGEVSASMAWGGVRLALLSSVAGLAILALAFLLWFPLRWRLQGPGAGARDAD